MYFPILYSLYIEKKFEKIISFWCEPTNELYLHQGGKLQSLFEVETQLHCSNVMRFSSIFPGKLMMWHHSRGVVNKRRRP